MTRKFLEKRKVGEGIGICRKKKIKNSAPLIKFNSVQIITLSEKGYHECTRVFLYIDCTKFNYVEVWAEGLDFAAWACPAAVCFTLDLC